MSYSFHFSFLFLFWNKQMPRNYHSHLNIKSAKGIHIICFHTPLVVATTNTALHARGANAFKDAKVWISLACKSTQSTRRFGATNSVMFYEPDDPGRCYLGILNSEEGRDDLGTEIGWNLKLILRRYQPDEKPCPKTFPRTRQFRKLVHVFARHLIDSRRIQVEPMALLWKPE